MAGKRPTKAVAGVMKTTNRLLCGILAALMLTGSAMPVSAAAEAETPLPEVTAATAEYFSYYDATSRVPFLTERITLSARDGQLSDEAAREAGHLGEADSVCLAGGDITWNITLPKKARFLVKVRYVGEESNYSDSSVSLSLDGTVPFEEAGSVRLTRLWKDAGGITQDSLGNDTIPEQEQVMVWNTVALQDFAIFSAEPLYFCLDEGEHTITLRSWSKEPLHIAGIELTFPEEVPSDEEVLRAYQAAGYTPVAGYYKKLQAETPSLKSTQSIYPTYDRSSPATEPYDAYNIRRNTIGDGNWSDPGSWVSYVIDDVPADGLYYLTIKYRQHQMSGTSTFRTVTVNGSIPSEAYRNVAFPYHVNWQNKTIAGETGEAVPVYLQEGKNEIRLEATVGKWAEVLRKVEASTQRLNDMYVQMVMITGTTPDKYFDYDLETEIPDLVSCFTNERKVLQEMADEFDRLNGKKTTQSETLRGAVTQLASMLEDPKSIPQRISNFRDTISSLSTWVYENMDQSLELDYIIVHSADQQIPSARASFWARLKHFFLTFFLSFVKDYNMVGSSGGEGETITVWTTTGRDQASILMDMITEDFTAETGIQVNVSLVQTGFIEATLAGTGPDVAIGVSRGQPVNLACRGALMDLSQFEGFDEVTARFSETAMVPYQYEGGSYAIPNTQGYYMMFYRKDILEKLGLEIPQTWEELLRIYYVVHILLLHHPHHLHLYDY